MAGVNATVANAQHTADQDGWTAYEVFSAVAPYRVSVMTDPATQLKPATREAHVVAVLAGLGWNPKGRYPLHIWMQLGV